jgi:integrase
MMKIAARLGYNVSYAIRDVERPKVPEQEPRFLSEEEIETVLQAAIRLGKKNKRYAHLYPIIHIALQTGMRKQGLFNYKWTDNDFKNRTVKIVSKEDWHTKNYRVRYIGMTDALLEVLEEVRQYQKENSYESEYVLTYRGNKLIDKIDRGLQRLAEEAGAPDLNLHVLRHTFASHLVMNGVDLREVQELLGHQDYSTTLRYAHLAPGHVKDRVKALPYGRKKQEGENEGK